MSLVGNAEGGALMSVQQIDTASLHSLVSGLARRSDPDWTRWEQHAIAEITLGLLYRPTLIIPPPPRGADPSAVGDSVDHIYRILKGFVRKAPVAAARRGNALKVTKEWVRDDPGRAGAAYKALEKDASFDLFAREEIERYWP
jgi:hypothetical protein